MEPIRLVLLTGFLGSGKTTLLRHWAKDPHIAAHLSILVNERGALGLDQELIAQESSTGALHIEQLTSGCICCTLQGALPQALLDLSSHIHGKRPHWIIIEASGLSLASEVAFALQAFCSGSPDFQLDSIVAMVDAHNARRAFEEHNTHFLNQIQSADLVVINKQDLLPTKTAQTTLQTWLTDIAPRATFVWTQQSHLDPRQVLGDPLEGTANSPADDKRKHALPFLPTQDRLVSPHELESKTILLPHAMNWAELEPLLENLGKTLFRFKGIVAVFLQQKAPVVRLIQGVGELLEWESLDQGHPLSNSPRRLILIGNPTPLEQAENQLHLLQQMTYHGRRAT